MAEQRRFVRRGILLVASGLFVFLLYLYFFIPFGEGAETVRWANPFYLLLAFGALFLSSLLFSTLATLAQFIVCGGFLSEIFSGLKEEKNEQKKT